MHFPLLTIGKPNDKKGRTFSVHYIASIQAGALFSPTNNGTIRPVLFAYAGSSSAVRAFTANLRAGLPCAVNNTRFELLRSLSYRYQITAPVQGQALVIAYLPDLFHLQPAAQHDDSLRFVSAVPRWWLDRQEALLARDFGSDARDYARAMAFVARLDARSPLPIANDPDFHRSLLELALDAPWTHTGEHPRAFTFDGLDALGLDSPILCDVPAGVFGDFLAAATSRLLPRECTHLPARSTAQGQLALGFLTA